MTLLRVTGLRKAFDGVEAVAGVGFALAAGEMLALIGPNGAGKTTCFNCLDGQISADAGSVLLDGREILGLPPRTICRLGVGRSFQIAAVFGSMTVRENVQVSLLAARRRLLSFGRAVRHRPAGEAEAVLAGIGIAHLADAACGTLAYGDLKRVELALTLAQRPRLLLMDEPTAGMPPRERRDLMALVAALARERGIGVLFTEHDMDIVFGHADRVLVMSRGRLVAEGAPAEVRRDARVRELYLGTGE